MDVVEPEKPPAAADDTGFRIGHRAHAAGDPRRVGTVRYIGQVTGRPGTWVGVDWDDGAGKHDGTIEGVRYFETKGERSGSLLRPKNLSAGISFLQALHSRYRGMSTKEEEEEMYVLSSTNRRVPVKLLGKDKVQQKLNRFEELSSISVAYLGVSSIETSDEINVLIPNLKELDLEGNLLCRWEDIGSIYKALPDLKILNLSRNLLEHYVPELPSFQSMHILVLNNCGIKWEQVEILKSFLPLVEELHLMSNKLRAIEVTDYVKEFDSLRLLNLEDNSIDSWDEILKLSQLPSLEQLHLNKNHLKNVWHPYLPKPCSLNKYDIHQKHHEPFENLQCLLVGSNQIKDMSSIDSLNHFPSLVDIRLSDNPIVDPAKGGFARFILVAHLAKVSILNGSEVSLRERRESEIRYVHLVMDMASVGDTECLHPRYFELKKLHSIDDGKSSTGSMRPQKMGSGLLKISLKCVGPSISEKQPLVKKLPPTTTVGKLKDLCGSFFRLKGVKLQLFMQEEGSPLPQLFDDDSVCLAELGIGKEATILVDENW